MRVRRWRRVAGVAVGAVVALVAVGCGPEESAAEKPAGKPAPVTTPYKVLPERLESDGTTITVGDPAARRTVALYEDPRCPVCRTFEETGGAPAALDLARERTVKMQYTLASFLDKSLGGHGSVRAVNALRAALEQGKFAEYHAVLYRDQPEESVDGFTTARLLELASKVPGLRGARFDKAVEDMTYRSFVTRSEAAFESSGAEGTPTVLLDGAAIPQDQQSVVFDRGQFAKYLTLWAAAG
ncbi:MULTISPECIES: DsbA family protein [unclassified Streptomyces]|uniref:DsbA family protein n=1 Tax=unclassified Streptomyces TaxID=2593676 RepID=UPI0035AC03C4